MLAKRIGTVRNKGKRQALLHENFSIDDRSFETILAYIVSYLKEVNFYDTNNEINGRWDSLVLHDSIIYMAVITQEPVVIVLQEGKDEEIIALLLKWYDKAKEWHNQLRRFNKIVLADKIKNIITDVLKLRREELLKEQKRRGLLTHPGNPYVAYTEASLAEIAKTFEKAILHIQNFTKEYLKDHIFSEQDHRPNNAMYISFALLYQHVQKDINTIARRHLDFYYRDVLQQTHSEGIATKTIVSFIGELKKGSFRIPSEIKLSAGKLFENKEEVVFKTKAAVLVHPIELLAVRTLYFNKNPYIDIGTDSSLISNILINELPVQKKSTQIADRWPLFGADQDILVASEIKPEIAGTLGFMIGAPVLYLEEGKREVSVRFNFEAETWDATFWRLLQEIKCNEDLPMDVVFNRVFEEAFKIAYTTKEKWISQPHYGSSFDAANRCFELHLVLDNTDPPLTAFLAEAEQSEWPMLRVLLDEYAPVYAYSFFKGMQLESIEIEVSVSRLKNLSLYNNIGKMPLAKSFDLFGPLPSLNDFLMIGKSELFKKELKHFNIHIDWANVPNLFGGFEAYYAEYGTALKTDSFQVALQTLSNGNWYPIQQEQQQIYPLYKEEPCTSPEGYDTVKVSEGQDFTAAVMGPFEFSRNYSKKDPLTYDIHAESGFLKLTLVAPNEAFGNEVYQKDATAIISKNAIRKENNPLPNPPFVPKIKGISLDYTASDIIYFNKSFSNESNADRVVGDYIHITPFENQKIVRGSQIYERSMFYDFEEEGYVYISLTGVDVSMAFSLYFDLWNKHPEHHTEESNINFQFKEGGFWTTLEAKHILADGTHQLTQSGIIELKLPENVSIAIEGHYELRIAVKKDAYCYPVLGGIYANVVEASCIVTDKNLIGKQIPANSISKLVEKVPGISGVMQPSNSYGGKTPSTEDQFYVEVSERLRHKDRAVTLRDYEQLILTHFHGIAAAKCTNLNADFEPEPGKVTIIVLGEKWGFDNHWYFNLSQLNAMRDFIQTKSNAHTQVEVRNPSVEWMVVNCVVEFHEKFKGGYYVENLNHSINQYLCPLTYKNETVEQGIGVGVVPRMLMSYIEDLAYVKSVKKLDIEHIIKYGVNDFSVHIHKENHEVRPTKPWAILVPEAKHNIFSPEILEENTLEDVETQNFQIGIDYIIAGDTKAKDTALEESTSASISPKKEKKTSSSKGNTILNFKVK